MRTDAEILAHIAAVESDDFFGFIRGDLISYLPFESAKPFLKDDVTPKDWKERPRDRESVIAQIEAYMPFAWDKANNRRGLSAGRSINHMQAWLWMLGEETAADSISHYTLYGKPQLRAICEHFGWDWSQWDGGLWTNYEHGDGSPPLPAADLAWAALGTH